MPISGLFRSFHSISKTFCSPPGQIICALLFHHYYDSAFSIQITHIYDNRVKMYTSYVKKQESRQTKLSTIENRKCSHLWMQFKNLHTRTQRKMAGQDSTSVDVNFQTSDDLLSHGKILKCKTIDVILDVTYLRNVRCKHSIDNQFAKCPETHDGHPWRRK